MTKYKRWMLLLTALTVFVVPIESLKATSLIHAGKFTKLLNTTTTTTQSTSLTEEPPKDGLTEKKLDEKPDEEMFVEVNGTKILLTGIPQIDYQWDPNLPRELNGFNLSTYPFLDFESMPLEEDIGFNCDDKINGFYASIKYGCQLYHHCLYGVRSDFICANFTAFDQKTFICHFASEVDCKNSYKYWSRNDDLYKATTEKATTAAYGLVPLFDRNLYKRPAPGGLTSISGLSSLSKGSKNAAAANRDTSPVRDTPGREPVNNHAPPPVRNVNTGSVDYANPAGQRPANRPLRRPYRRRRPQVDYYYYDDEYEDDFYDDRGRRRQQRPRNRRPLYDDYRDNRRPQDDDFDDYEDERRPYRNRNRSESRRNGDDRKKNEDRRFDDRRRPNNDDRKSSDDRKRPIEDERRSYDDRRGYDERRPADDRKKQDDERSQSDDRKSNRRKNYDEPAEDKRRDRIPERGDQTEKRQASDDPLSGEKVEKPLGSLFDRARPLSKISRPASSNEKNKFSSKPTDKLPSSSEEKKKDDEYYEEYDEVPASSSLSSSSTTVTTTTTTTTTQRPTTTTKYQPRLKTLTTVQTTKKPATTTSAAQDIEYYEDEYYDTVTPAKAVLTSTAAASSKLLDRASLFSNRNRNANENYSFSSSSTASPSSTTDYFRFRFKNPTEKVINTRYNLPYVEETSQAATSTLPSRKPLPSLPSIKKFASQQTQFEPMTTTETTPRVTPITASYNSQRFYERNTDQVKVEPVDDQKFLMRIIKRPFLPSRGGNPYKARGLQPVGPASLQQQNEHNLDNQPLFTAPGSDYPTGGGSLEITRQQQTNDDHHTQHKTTLDDIYNEEYDVELNDALNPMLKPLTSSRGISGFSFSSLPNSDKDGYRAQSQKSIQKTEAPKTSSTTTTTTTESPQYEYEEVEYEYK